MLEKGVRSHLAIRQGELPEPVGEDGGKGGEAGQPQGTQPAKPATQYQGWTGEFGDDRRRRDRYRRGQPEMLHLGDRAAEIQNLVDAALEIGGAEAEQRNGTN